MSEKEILTEDEKEIIECLVRGWKESGYRLYGNLSYSMVDDLMTKLGIKLDQKPSESAFEGIEHELDAQEESACMICDKTFQTEEEFYPYVCKNCAKNNNLLKEQSDGLL